MTEFIAVTRGPILLARDARLQGPIISAIFIPVSDKNDYVDLELVLQNHNNIWMQFNLLYKPESYTEKGSQPTVTIMCDYASAGNTISEDSNFKVWFPQLIHPKNLEGQVK